MRVMVTGADGFIGRNLSLRLGEAGHETLAVTRRSSKAEIVRDAAAADAVIHLAGVNRASEGAEFEAGNDRFTADLCETLARSGRAVPVWFASSIQAGRDSDYGRTKRAAERHLESHARATGAPVAICRLVNVFGKWARPDYNSAVATFCHRIARDEPIEIHDETALIHLVHVDDVGDTILSWLAAPDDGVSWPEAGPRYDLTVGDLAARLRGFRDIRTTHTVGPVGVGLDRALYATYVSYLPVEDFSYPLTVHGDERGVFVEMLRTGQSGQVSFFTARPGVTRGGHYHHAKTEKFLVLQGQARFGFRSLADDTRHSIDVTGATPRIVETVPGWAHDIANTGDEDLIVMLWANELFDPARPDTIASPVDIHAGAETGQRIAS